MGKAVENGKTYSEFIQDLQQVNHRGDNDVGLVNGKPLIKGGRHTRGSMDGTVDFWELMNGKFTPEEEQVISSNVVEPPAQITNVEQAERFLQDYNQDGSEIVKGASARKEFVSPQTDFEIEPELNKFINRQDLDIKPTPQEVRIKERQEDEFAKIEREQKPPAEIEPTSVPDSDVVDMSSMKLTQEQLEAFGNASPTERQNIMNNHNEEIINTTH